MSTTLNLPYSRWVAQVSTGAPRSKSTYQALMVENLTALQACPWREAADVPVALANHDFTKASHFSDACDAFKMTGNYDGTAMTEVAYAGMAAYRFKIPADALITRPAAAGTDANNDGDYDDEGDTPPVDARPPVAISALSLPISRDRFLKGGVRLACELTSRATPSTDWDTVRGGESPAASAYLANTAAYLTAAKPAADTVEIDLSTVSSGNPSAYLWIYVTLEDYTDWWDKYSASEARQYAIEGSAMLVGGSASVTFAGEVTADGEQAEYQVRNGSYPAGSTVTLALKRFMDGSPIPPDPAKVSLAPDYMGSGTLPTNGVTGWCKKPYVTPGSQRMGHNDYTAYRLLLTLQTDGGWNVRRRASATQLQTALTVPVYTYEPQTPSGSTGYTDELAAVESKNAELLTKYYSSPAYRLMMSGGAISIAAVPAGFEDTSTSSQISVDSRWVVLVGGEDGVYALGTLHVGNSANSIYPADDDGKVCDGRADLILPRRATRTRQVSWGANGQIYQASVVTSVDAGTRAVGIVDGGIVVNGELRFKVDGTISGVEVNYGAMSDTSFLAYGDFRRINGVACRNLAICIIATGEVLPVAYQDNLTPNTYLGYAISKDPDATERYVVSGGFTKLGGGASSPVAFFNGSNGTFTGIGSTPILTGECKLTGYSGTTVQYIARSGGTFMADIGAAPSSAAIAGMAAGLRAAYSDFYAGKLALGEGTDGAGFRVAYVDGPPLALPDGTLSSVSKIWTMEASALLVPFSAPHSWAASGIRLEWTAPETVSEGTMYHVWLKRGELVTSADGLAARALWDATATEVDGWELIGTVEPTAAEAMLAFGRRLEEPNNTILLTAYVPQDGISFAADMATSYGIVGWKPAIALIG